MGCHSNFSDPNVIAGLIDPSNPDDSTLLQKVEDGEMPKGGPPLSENQIAMIRAYISQQQEIKIEPTWSSLKIVLINRSCITCHSQGAVKPKKPYMDTYEEVANNGVADDMAEKMQLGKMPPKGHAPPSSEILKAFIDWDMAGAPQN